MDLPAARNRPSVSQARNNVTKQLLDEKLVTERAKSAYFLAAAKAMESHSRAMDAAALFYERQSRESPDGKIVVICPLLAVLQRD